MIIKIIKSILDFLFSIFFLFLSLFYIFNYSSLKKIYAVKNIIIHKAGGFGHQCLINDMIRYSKRKYLYILLFDRTRFNKYISLCFRVPHIYIPICAGPKLTFAGAKLFKVGEYEGSFFNFIEFTVSLILRLIFKKRVVSTQQYYNFFKKDNQNLLNSINFTKEKFKDHNSYGDIYFYFIKNHKKMKPKLPLNLYNSVIQKLDNNKGFNLNKICTIYLRQKGKDHKDLSNSSRVGSSKKEYYALLKYLISKNYTILLVGDDLFSTSDLEIFKGRVLNFNSLKISKDLFQIFSFLNNQLYIGEAGGAQFFGLYSKLSVGINFFPLGYAPPYNYILYKNVYKKNNKPISKIERASLNWRYDLQKYNYVIKDNTSEEMVKAIKLIV